MAIRVDMGTTPWPVAGLVDEVLALYVEWREGADGVADTYRNWCAAAAGVEALWFAAYTAALDQEEAAASAYAQSIRELEWWLPVTRPRRQR